MHIFIEKPPPNSLTWPLLPGRDCVDGSIFRNSPQFSRPTAVLFLMAGFSAARQHRFYADAAKSML